MRWFIQRMDRRECARWVAICVGIVSIARFMTLTAQAQVSAGGNTSLPDADSSRWPLHLDTPSGQITVYQPQMTNFDGDKLTARAAVSVIPPGQQDPTFGAIWMESRVATDRVARTVQILDTTVTKVRFPDASGPNEQTLTDAMRSTLPQQPMTLSLDSLLAMLEVVQKEKAATRDISNDVPQIIFRDHASVLVRFDGDPRLEQVPNSGFLRAVNTPFFIILDPQSKTYFLKGGGQWFTAPQALGPYQNVNNIPPPISQLADSMGYKDPEQALSPAQASGIEIVTTTAPAELIWTDGPEQMSTLDNTDLLYVANTDCDIFLHIDTQTIYILVSGRWFSAPHRTGPWTFVAPDKLPDDFQRIPADSSKGDVLAHVANTQAAKDAVADTFVPQTAAINRQNYEQPDVTYDGEPNFQPVENTTISYAVNTPDSVVLVDRHYYCCHSAVWYTCESPRGHWLLCDRVPDVIYTIPPSCPIYSCRYCYVYDSTPDILYCGYLPGYVGCYHYDGVVVYGTGYYYRPWVGHTYYPRPFTYGFDAHYDSYQNHWGFSVGLAFGGGDAWVGHRDDFVRHDDWFGHGGYRPAIIHDDRNVNIYRTNITNVTINNNRTNIHNAQYNVYDRRKDVKYDSNARPELRTPAHHEPARNEAPRNEVAHNDVHADVHGDGHGDVHGAPTHVDDHRAVDTRDNVYSDSNGDVYRKTLDGWEKRDHNQWTPAAAGHEDPKHPAETPHATDDHHAAAPPHDVAPPHDGAEHHSDKPAETPHDSKVDHPAEKPAPAEPDRTDLNRDFRARVEGEQRAHSDPAPEPHDEPRSEPKPEPHGGGSQRDGADSHSSDSRSGGGASGSGGSGNGNSKH